MPNVMAALTNIGGPPSVQHRKVWLTPTTRVPCSNTAKTRNPLKFAGVPQTNETISVCPGVDYSLYMDDFLICYRSKHIHIIERHLQRSLNKLQEWADTNGFKFSTAKTVCVHFCRLRKFHSDPQLLLNGSPIPVVEEVKFLGIIFDKKLSFLPHLRYLIVKKALNLLRVVAHTSWGADQQTLLHLYRSLIRSKLDYGCIVYGSSRGSVYVLALIEPLHPPACVYLQTNHLSTSGGESSPFNIA